MAKVLLYFFFGLLAAGATVFILWTSHAGIYPPMFVFLASCFGTVVLWLTLFMQGAMKSLTHPLNSKWAFTSGLFCYLGFFGLLFIRSVLGPLDLLAYIWLIIYPAMFGRLLAEEVKLRR